MGRGRLEGFSKGPAYATEIKQSSRSVGADGVSGTVAVVVVVAAGRAAAGRGCPS